MFFLLIFLWGCWFWFVGLFFFCWLAAGRPDSASQWQLNLPIKNNNPSWKRDRSPSVFAYAEIPHANVYNPASKRLIRCLDSCLEARFLDWHMQDEHRWMGLGDFLRAGLALLLRSSHPAAFPAGSFALGAGASRLAGPSPARPGDSGTAQGPLAQLRSLDGGQGLPASRAGGCGAVRAGWCPRGSSRPSATTCAGRAGARDCPAPPAAAGGSAARPGFPPPRAGRRPAAAAPSGPEVPPPAWFGSARAPEAAPAAGASSPPAPAASPYPRSGEGSPAQPSSLRPPSHRRAPWGRACFPGRMMNFSARSSLPAAAARPRLPGRCRGGKGRGERGGAGAPPPPGTFARAWSENGCPGLPDVARAACSPCPAGCPPPQRSGAAGSPGGARSHPPVVTGALAPALSSRPRVRQTLIVITINNNNDVPSPHPPCRVAAGRPGPVRPEGCSARSPRQRCGRHGNGPRWRSGRRPREPPQRVGAARPPHLPPPRGAERRAVTPWPAPSRRRAPASGGRQCGAGGPRALGSAALLSEWQPGAHVLGFQPAGLRSDNGVR